MTSLRVEGLNVAHQEWVERAACRGKWAEADFFPGKDEVPLAPLTYCPKCVVRRDCLQFALQNDIMQGWYGGVSPRRRRNMKPGEDDPKALTLQTLWQMRESGFTHRRIASETGLAESTVRTAIRRLRNGVV